MRLLDTSKEVTNNSSFGALSADAEERRDSRPPHTCLPVWIDRFFSAYREVNPSKISREFISSNVIGSGHEGKVLVALRYLGLTRVDGTPTSTCSSLRVIGDDFKANLTKVIQESYSDVLSTVSVGSASLQGTTNFFIQRYGMSQGQAQDAIRFFVHLTILAGMTISDELRLLDEKKTPSVPSHKPPRAASTPPATPSPPSSSLRPGLLELKMGDVTIWLPKGNKSAAEQAKKLLDLYIEGLGAIS